MDETGNCTVHNNSEIIVPKGQEQVGAATSGERGSNIILSNICLNWVRTYVCISGWSNSEKFILWSQDFIDKERPCPGHKKLLILDNYESHCQYEAVTLAKNNGIILLTLPPHTRHKLQHSVWTIQAILQ